MGEVMGLRKFWRGGRALPELYETRPYKGRDVSCEDYNAARRDVRRAAWPWRNKMSLNKDAYLLAVLLVDNFDELTVLAAFQQCGQLIDVDAVHIR